MLRKRLTYANVMATLALFVALGGSAYAVNTVRSSDIVDNEVYSADVRNDSLAGGGLTSGDIANGAMTTLEIRDDNQSFGGLLAEDLGPGSVGSSEIAPFAINEGDIASNVIGSRHITDGTLNDEDISQSTTINFAVNIDVVVPNTCIHRSVTGLNVGGDHLLLTASSTDALTALSYSAEYPPPGTDGFLIKVCNPGNDPVFDGQTHFNLLVIDAQ